MNMQLQKRKGYISLAIAALTCPCHLPIYLAIFGGTALGVFLRDNILLLIFGLAAIFLLTLTRGLKLIKEDKEQEEGSDSL
ncbi:MAG: mercury resistance protein [Deltaproteobacteria bacterium]|nr:mercury resistance protein [Deltaproteobacteria bacterium]